jgi:preprotein translocase subunit SecE
MFQKASTFISEVKSELRKASWPWDPDPKVKGFKKYKELIDSTVVILIAMVLLAAYVAVWDLVHREVVDLLTRLGRGN